jgi:hypothetical protein
MEAIANSALAAAAPRGDALHVAAFQGAEPYGAGFTLDPVADDRSPYDDDRNFVDSDDVFPDEPFAEDFFADGSFPEDPFPEALFADVLFADLLFAGAAASGAGTPRPGLEDRIAAASCLLRADLTAVNAGLIDQLRASEDVKGMLTGQQARLAVTFEARLRQESTDRTALSAEDLGKDRRKENGLGAAEQIALARGESPNRGVRLLGMAKALVQMPHTLAALDTGQLNEERVMHVVKETACLSVEDRTAVDEELAADTGTFVGAGTRTVIAAVRAATTRRDPRSVAQRASHAASERTVSLRPAPDCMAYLTALLPVQQGVAVYAALTRRADSLHTAGDPRSRDQIKADTLVEWTTGTPGGITGIELNLVMTDRTLLQGDSEPARIPGYGVVPATWARSLIAHGGNGAGEQGPAQGQGLAGRHESGSTDSVRPASSDCPSISQKELKSWVRRLYTAPDTGDLVAMDSQRRLFPAQLRHFIQTRDDTCRTPYCDAPIRHHDHIIPWHDGGPTTLANGAGLCEACNHTKELPGWKAKPRPGPRHAIELTTPTGHTYSSTAPPLPGTFMGNPRELGPE